jgi:hypothetical protein
VSQQITIFTGRFGSGKTEIALNVAVQMADQGSPPFLIDLDVVTPYFRTREKADEMVRHGVEVIAPFEVGRYADLPAISPRILGAIEQKARPVVLDVGGDVHGARALSPYAAAIERRGYTMNFVVNPYRPFMDTAADIEAAVREIESSARLRASHLVSNPNLMSESTLELILDGHRRVQEASRALELPISMLVVDRLIAEQVHKLVDASREVEQRVPELPVLVLYRFWQYSF